jgi:hypothetical protein
MPRFKQTNREQGVIIPVFFEHEICPGSIEHAIHYFLRLMLDLVLDNSRVFHGYIFSTVIFPILSGVNQ